MLLFALKQLPQGKRRKNGQRGRGRDKKQPQTPNHPEVKEKNKFMIFK
jgi:hypothetical protein